MTDPAISAAQRAWCELYPNSNAKLFYRGLHTTANYGAMSKNLVSSAREMAKSVQELHRPVDDYGDGILHCFSCSPERWPCETAKRVYPSEELNQ